MGLCQSKNQGQYQYDLIVIGGGSGGLSCAKEAAKLGKNVAICDFVTPTPLGTTWGLGGTCVNVGCIPKRIMHQASLNREFMKDCLTYGWNFNEEATHDWNSMVDSIQNYIHSLNFGYRVVLNNKKIKYYNGLAEFVDSHTVKLRLKSDEEDTITANKIVVAVGCRPRYMEIPGGTREDGFCITSDDLFSLPQSPGKVLCIGGGYIAVECAGFLAGLGYDVTIMVRSVILREFDTDIAAMISETLTERGAKVLPGWSPTEIISVGEDSGQLKVTSVHKETKQELEDTFQTIIMAIGRDPCTPGLKLENAGVKINEKSKRVTVDAYDRTNVSNIFAIGDCADGRPELTPPAIRAGHLLAQRLFGGGKEKMNYHNVATTIFSPVEYGSIGLSENAAIDKHGQSNIEVYHQQTTPLEYVLPNRDKDLVYAKLICLKGKKEKVIGFHYLGPYAGEVTQGFSVAMRFSPSKSDFDATIGIHPTCAEIFTKMAITKASGISFKKTGC